MFYSKFMFVKKGPLFKLWVAAHNGKKLSKHEVARVKVADSADTIVNPSAPLALRLSSTLLLGLVRIYQRQVRYLQEDCSDALTKMKLVFRPGQIDLPADGARAPAHAITLQSNYLELELDEPALGLDLEDDAALLLDGGGLLEGPGELTVELRRADAAGGDEGEAAFTLSLALDGDDNLLLDAAPADGAGAGGEFDGDMLALGGDDDLLPFDEDELAGATPEREVRRGEASPVRSARASLGGGADLLDAGGDAGKPLEFPLEDDGDMLDLGDDSLLALGGDDEMPLPDGDEVAGAAGGAAADGEAAAAAAAEAEAEAEEEEAAAAAAAAAAEEEEEGGAARARRPRKRKLERPDAVIELSRKVIAAQLRDTRSVVLAQRPVRPMAKRRRLSSLERAAGSSAYDAHLAPDDDAYAASLSARLPASMARMAAAVAEMRALPAHGEERDAEQGEAPEDEELEPLDGGDPLPLEDDELPPIEDDDGNMLDLGGDDELPPLVDDELPPAGDDEMAAADAGDAAAGKEAGGEEEDEAAAASSFFGADGDAAAAAAELGGENAREDAGGFSRRTRKMHEVLSREMAAAGGDGSVSFERLVEGRPAKTVAGVFYELLVLKKHDYVSVSQPEAFGDIAVARGPSFARPFPGSSGAAAVRAQ